MEVQVFYPRTTSMLDRCCKSKGYFLKKSCLKPQTPLEVHFGPFGLPSGGILSTCTGQDASQTAPRAPSKCPRAPKRPPVNVNFHFNVNFRSCSCYFNDEFSTLQAPTLLSLMFFLTAQGQRSNHAAAARLLCSSWCKGPRSISRSRGLHEVRCPNPSRAWVQGSGVRKRSLDGKTPTSPHYGGYTTLAVRCGDPLTE